MKEGLILEPVVARDIYRINIGGHIAGGQEKAIGREKNAVGGR